MARQGSFAQASAAIGGGADAVAAHVNLLGLVEGLSVGAVAGDVVAREALSFV